MSLSKSHLLDATRWLVSAFSLFFIFPAHAQNENVLESPNGELTFQLQKNGSYWEYSIAHKSKQVVLPSRLGFELGNPYSSTRDGWPDALRLTGQQTRTVDRLWNPVYGEKSEYRDHFQEKTFQFSRGDDTTIIYMELAVRAYDEGIAFRYSFPENRRTQILTVVDEKTIFRFPSYAQGWFSPSPQAEYEKHSAADWQEKTVMPFTVALGENLYASVAEADADDFAVTTLLPVEGEKGALQTTFFGAVTETSPFHMPWRVVMVAETPGQLLENNFLILNLNPPNQLDQTWWIKPGKVVREVTLSTEGAKKLVDFCAEHGMDYIHFDAGWYGHEYEVASDATTITVDPRRNPKGDLDLKEAIHYAKSKGVGTLVYVNHRALEKQLDEILPLFHAWGINGIKFGFVHTGSHRWSAWLHEAIKKCADYQLMVDIHDNYRPTGFSRTYPNLMTQEGILGNEGMPDATHNAVLPFTRFLAGAADYTMCYYYRKEFGHERRHIQTTPAHQLALPVVFYSPLQWLFWYDKPYEDYQEEPELEFWKHVPTVWDDTNVLSGAIGEHIAVARRTGEEWFAAAIVGNKGGEVSFPLDFLGEPTTWKVTIYRDGGAEVNTRTHVAIETKEVTARDNLSFVLPPSGGVALHIAPVSN